jgi:hypothetical protein
MPAPETATYHVDAKEAAHQALLDLIDAGVGVGFIRIKTAADVLLAQIPLDDPGGSVSAVTGQLTLAIADSDSAEAEGTAAYGEICNAGGVAYLSLPVTTGVSAVSGYLVLNTLVFAIGANVSITSAVIG